MANWYVIFGAAVRPDGTPSGTLRRRVEGAVAAAAADPTGCFMPTGGVGHYPPAEADVMKSLLLAADIAPERIVTEPDSTDTLESVLACAALLRARDDVERVIVCTSSYHAPRCVWLLGRAGTPAVAARIPSDRAALGLTKWAWYHVREVPAFVWDTILVLAHGVRSRTVYR